MNMVPRWAEVSQTIEYIKEADGGEEESFVLELHYESATVVLPCYCTVSKSATGVGVLYVFTKPYRSRENSSPWYRSITPFCSSSTVRVS